MARLNSFEFEIFKKYARYTDVSIIIKFPFEEGLTNENPIDDQIVSELWSQFQWLGNVRGYEDLDEDFLYLIADETSNIFQITFLFISGRIFNAIAWEIKIFTKSY